jgi:hypothetical protein
VKVAPIAKPPPATAPLSDDLHNTPPAARIIRLSSPCMARPRGPRSQGDANRRYWCRHIGLHDRASCLTTNWASRTHRPYGKRARQRIRARSRRDPSPGGTRHYLTIRPPGTSSPAGNRGDGEHGHRPRP